MRYKVINEKRPCAKCRNCGKIVFVEKMPDKSKNTLTLLDENVKCCPLPDFHWVKEEIWVLKGGIR